MTSKTSSFRSRFPSCRRRKLSTVPSRAAGEAASRGESRRRESGGCPDLSDRHRHGAGLQHRAVKSRVDGEIIQVLFQEGQDVKAGDPRRSSIRGRSRPSWRSSGPRAHKDQATAGGRAARPEALRGPVATRLRLPPAGGPAAGAWSINIGADRQRPGADRLRADAARLHHDPLADRGAAGIRQIDQGNYVHAVRRFPDRGYHPVSADLGDLHPGGEFGRRKAS